MDYLILPIAFAQENDAITHLIFIQPFWVVCEHEHTLFLTVITFPNFIPMQTLFNELWWKV